MKRVGLILALMAATLPSWGWSSRGHQVVAYVAQRHLSTELYYMTRDLLDGDAMAYVGPWLDTASRTDEYAYTLPWHYFNVNAGQDYEDRYVPSEGDAITALYDMADVLADREASHESRSLALKILIHVVGDIHQPLHAGHKTDLGGNYITVYYNGERTNLHSFWDYSIVADGHPGWNYYEWWTNIDTLPDEVVEELSRGTIDDWGRESVDLADAVYRYFPQGKTITQEDVEHWLPTVEHQLVAGGIRLAALITEALSGHEGGLESIAAEEAMETLPLLYDLLGRRVDESTAMPGIYVRTDGTKILIR